jgi:hypothetical protein
MECEMNEMKCLEEATFSEISIHQCITTCCHHSGEGKKKKDKKKT